MPEIKITQLELKCIHGNIFKYSFSNQIDSDTILSDKVYQDIIYQLKKKVMGEEECASFHDMEIQSELIEKYKDKIKVAQNN